MALTIKLGYSIFEQVKPEIREINVVQKNKDAANCT